MSLKKTLVKLLAGTMLFSSLYNLPTKRANADFLINVPVVGVPVKRSKTTTNQHTNKTLYKQKQEKQEFKPPELPYCRVVRADWEGVIIDYWDKRGKKHTYRWAVTQPHWYVGGATVDLVHEYPEQDNGDRDYEGLDECLIRAGKKVLTDSYYGGEGPLYIDEIDGYPFGKVVLYYTTNNK